MSISTAEKTIPLASHSCWNRKGVLSAMIPQACRLPADTTVNVNPPVTFDGDATLPPRTLAPSPIWPSAFEPQQYTAALLTPQVNPSPALSSVNVRPPPTATGAGWKPPAPHYKTGVMAKYAKLVSSASEGAVTTAAGSAASSLAFTGDHIASEAILAAGLIFLGAGLIKAARRRPHTL